MENEMRIVEKILFNLFSPSSCCQLVSPSVRLNGRAEGQEEETILNLTLNRMLSFLPVSEHASTLNHPHQTRLYLI